MEAVSTQSAPDHYIIDTRTVVFNHRDQYLLVAPARHNWTKIAKEAYRLLIEGERKPIRGVLTRAKAEYGFEPNEVAGFLQELQARGVIYFDLEQEPRLEMAGARDGGGARVAFLNVTKRCNLKCPTCLSEALPTLADPPLNAWQTIMDRLAESGVSTVIVTGGEPTIRQDIVDLLSCARSRFRQVFLNTNGTLLNPELCAQLRDLLDQIHVSVDGSTPQIHDQFRGKGNFERTMQGIRFLREAGVGHIGLTPTLTRINIHDLSNMARLAVGLGVALRTSVFLPVGRGSCNAQVLTPSPEQLLNAFRDTHAAILEHSDQELEPQLKFLQVFAGMKLKCGAGCMSISVEGDGTVHVCNALLRPEFVMGNLLQAQDVQTITKESPIAREFDAINVENREVCKDCDVRYFCGGGCFAHSFLTHGNIQAVDPYCDFYRTILRAQVWTVRADASLRENVQALIDWLNSDGFESIPTEVRWQT
jgi:radical SAM protein with 4Fe4S-binding SPASM domain